MRYGLRTKVSTYVSDWMPSGDTTRQSVAGYIAGGYYNGNIYSGIVNHMFETDTAS